MSLARDYGVRTIRELDGDGLDPSRAGERTAVRAANGKGREE
jgi:hypothetical protein